MEKSWEDVIAELERTTVAVATLDLSAADFGRILEIMNQRSKAVARLREMTAATASPALIERLKAIVDEGERLEQKLLLLRAAGRAELARLRESAHLLRYAQGTAGARQRINCTG